MRSSLATAAAVAIALAGCDAREEEPPGGSATSSAPAAPTSVAAPTASAAPAPARSELTLIAGGDVSFGRGRGQMLLRDPARNDLAPLAKLFDAADLRFVNLECPITDRGGETVSAINQLVFNAPPAAAGVLSRARVDLVSLANNHAWDYGRQGLVDTLEHLERAGVAYVGAGRTRDEAYAPRLIEQDGFTIAFFAVTAVWNQEFSPHPGKELVADAAKDELLRAVRAARKRPGVDKVVVSHHGGYEYVDQPHEATRELLRAAVEAGADAVIGHHPHVVQRIGLVNGRPVLYSLGNLLMRMASGKPATEFGMLARLTLRRDGPTEVAVCPVRVFGFDAVPLAGDPDRALHEQRFRAMLDRLLRFGAMIEPDAAAELGAFGEDGCAPVRAMRRDG